MEVMVRTMVDIGEQTVRIAASDSGKNNKTKMTDI